jgi:HlyD family secretion protein
MSRWKWVVSPLVPSLVLAAFGLTGCSRGNGDAPLVGTLERDRIEIVAEESEPIVSLDVREGDRVALGQVLMKQDIGIATARFAQAGAEVEEAKHRLEELQKGARRETIAEARARLEAARATAERDIRELARDEEMVKQRLISQSQLDQSRAARDASAAAAREAEAALAELLNGTRIEQVNQAKAALNAAESSRRQLEITDARLVVRATRAGVVDALPYKAGERPPKGTAVAVLLADTPAFARVYVPEPMRARVVPRTRALITVDGIEGPLEGFVRWVASDAAFTPYFALTQRDRSRLAFLAEVEVTDGRARDLPAGVPVEVQILEGQITAGPANAAAAGGGDSPGADGAARGASPSATRPASPSAENDRG